MDDTNNPNININTDEAQQPNELDEQQVIEIAVNHEEKKVEDESETARNDETTPIEIRVEREETTAIEIQVENETSTTNPVELNVEIIESTPIELEIENETGANNVEVEKAVSLDLINNENPSILVDVDHCELKVVDDDVDEGNLEIQLNIEIKSTLNEIVDKAVVDCLNEQIGSLRKRGEQLNDVKQSIKLLNDQIREDLLIVIAELTAMLKMKIDEITDRIKGRLKDAYGVVRDAQTAIIERLNEVDAQLNDSQINSESLDNLQAQLDSIQKELKHMSNRCYYSPPQTASMNQSALTPASVYTCSLFDDNYLYPNVDYQFDLTKISTAINELSVHFICGASATNRSIIDEHDPNQIKSTVMSMEIGCGGLESGIVFDAVVSTGVTYDGVFWLQPAMRSSNEIELLDNAHKFKRNLQRANVYIDEVCKYVRLKRIGDDSWKTFAELKRVPEINEKCFCLEPKLRRWMRAVVLNIDQIAKTCQVRLLDSGLADSTQYPLDSILPWRFETDDLEMNELLNFSPRAIRCVLVKNCGAGDLEFEKQIEQETRFLFRDLTAHTPIKCLLLKQIDLNNNVTTDGEDLVWAVKLYRYQDFNQIVKLIKKEDAEANIPSHLGGEDNKTLNEVIAKSNRLEHERMKSNSQIRCRDFRVESGQVGSTSLMIKTRRENDSSSISVNQANSTPLPQPESSSDVVTSAKMQVDDGDGGEKNNVNEEEAANQMTISSTITLSASQQVGGPSDDNSDNQPMNNADDPALIQDVLDQNDEHRLHVRRSGKCLNIHSMSYDGIFWIRPLVDPKAQSIIDSLSEQIGSFIKCTQFKSFGELGVTPRLYTKCFVRDTFTVKGESERRENWHRGFIEEIYNNKVFLIRCLDKGSRVAANKHDIYPHRKITPLPKINYQAIRCYIGKKQPYEANGHYEFKKEFREKFRHALINCSKERYDFTLMGQIDVTKPDCTFTTKAWMVVIGSTFVKDIFRIVLNEFRQLTGKEHYIFVTNQQNADKKPSDSRNNKNKLLATNEIGHSLLDIPPGLVANSRNLSSLPGRLPFEYHGQPLLPASQMSHQYPTQVSTNKKSFSMHEQMAAFAHSAGVTPPTAAWTSSKFDRIEQPHQQPLPTKSIVVNRVPKSELFSIGEQLTNRDNQLNHHQQEQSRPPVTANEFFSEPVWEGSQSIENNSSSQADVVIGENLQIQQNQVAPQTDGLVDVAKNFLEHELSQPASIPDKRNNHNDQQERYGVDLRNSRGGRGKDRDRDNRNSFTNPNNNFSLQQHQQRSSSTHAHNRPSHREVCHRFQQHQHHQPLNMSPLATAAATGQSSPYQSGQSSHQSNRHMAFAFNQAFNQAVASQQHHQQKQYGHSSNDHHNQQHHSPLRHQFPSHLHPTQQHQQQSRTNSSKSEQTPGLSPGTGSGLLDSKRKDKKKGKTSGGCRPHNDGDIDRSDRSDGHGGGGGGGASGHRGAGTDGGTGRTGFGSSASGNTGNRDNDRRGNRRYDGKRHGTVDIFGDEARTRSSVTTTRVKTTTSYLEIYEGHVEDFEIGTTAAAAAAACEDDEFDDGEETGSSIYNDDVFIEDGDDEEDDEERNQIPFYLERELLANATRRHRHSSLNEMTNDIIATHATFESRHNAVVNDDEDDFETKRSTDHQQELQSKASGSGGSTSNQGSLGLGYSISSPMANLVVDDEDEANKTSMNSFGLIMESSQPGAAAAAAGDDQQSNIRAEESTTRNRRLWSPPRNTVVKERGRQRHRRNRNRPTTCVTSASSGELAGAKTRSFSADHALLRRDSAINLVSSTTSSSTSSSSGSTTTTSSSSMSSISKLKKMNAELFKDKEKDLGCEDEEESYLSCTDEINNNNNNKANRMTENTTTTTNLSSKTDDQIIIDNKIDEFKYEKRTNLSFDQLKVHTAAIITNASSLQSTTNQHSSIMSEKARLKLERLEKMKKLTMAIFVESFEDNSSSSSSSDNSSNASTLERGSPNSLREFEANEARVNRGSIIQHQQDEEDPFLFTSNPNNFANLLIDSDGNVTRVGGNVVSTKPPAPPGHQIQTNQRAPPASSSANNLLSPGGTDDTFETCYQSPTSNRHFAYDSDALATDGRARSDESVGAAAVDSSMSSTRRKIEFFNRRANAETEVKPRNRSSSSSDLPLPPPPTTLPLMADIDSLEPIAITDKLFEKFCLIENEEIMALGGDGDDDDNSESTLANNSKRSNHRAPAASSSNNPDIPDGVASKFVPNNANQFKIHSKILNDFLEAHANDQMSLTDPLSQHQLQLQAANQNKIEENQCGEQQQQQPTVVDEADQTANLQLSFSESQADSIDAIKKQLRYMSESGIGMFGPRPTTGRLQSAGGESGGTNSTILNNRSTIDISSYTSDSLFNSNFIVTPLCSDAVSPSGQNFIKSPLLHPNLRSQSQSQNSPNSFSAKSPCFSVPPPAPPLPKFFTARAVPISLAPNSQELGGGRHQLENCDEEKSFSAASSLPPPPPPDQIAQVVDDLNAKIEDLSSEDTDKMNKNGGASETTVTVTTSSSTQSRSSYSLPPPPPPSSQLQSSQNIPPAPPLPPHGIFSSGAATIRPSRRSTSLTTKTEESNNKNSTQSDANRSSSTSHGPQSRIKALTAQLNLAECLSAGHQQPMQHRSRITESGDNQSIKSPDPTHAQKSSPYRYGNQMVANFATSKPTSTTHIKQFEETKQPPLKRTVASQTDIESAKLTTGDKKPNRKRPTVADKIRDGEAAAAKNGTTKQHDNNSNFNLYGLDTETDEQSLRAMIGTNGKLPSPPPEFRNNVHVIPIQQHQQHPHSLSSSTSVATTVIPAASNRHSHLVVNGSNMAAHDKIKNWNSLQPIQSHTCNNDDLEQVQSTKEEIERQGKRGQDRKEQQQQDEEDDSIRANHRVQAFTSCPNLVQRRSPPPPPRRRPPPPPVGEENGDNGLEEDELLPTPAHTTFKLDHLVDINPRRLYPNTKFRARIHDVIDEHGRFHLEVIYPREDERKFVQIFKLFRLACKISPPPDSADLREGMRVGVFYKDDWHRAIVVDVPSNNRSNHHHHHPRVKFLDLGIERRVDAQTQMRIVDEKFFNVPLKALRCSLYVDENVHEVLLSSGHGVVRNEPLRLSSDARKFFVRVIYKKVLFAKVIEFTQDTQSTEPICKIRLGCQTHRGIIDVYLYLLSKFDRKRYELIKYLTPSTAATHTVNHNQAAQMLNNNNPVTPSSSTSTAATTTTATQSDSDSTAATYTLPSPPHSPLANSLVHESFENVSVGGINTTQLVDIEPRQQDDDEYDADILFSDLVGYFARMKQAVNGILNRAEINNNVYEKNNNNKNMRYIESDCQSCEQEDEYEKEEEEEEEERVEDCTLVTRGLDMTPVKEQRRRGEEGHGEDNINNNNEQDENELDRTTEEAAPAEYNYDGSLYIESIHLPSITFNEPQQVECAAQNCDGTSNKSSTRSHQQQQQQQQHRFLRSDEFYKMSIPMPPANPLSPPRLTRTNHRTNVNYNSDTDSSLMHAPCCQMPSFKHKRPKNSSSTKPSPRTEQHQKLFDEINNLAKRGELNSNNGKKVKFLS